MDTWVQWNIILRCEISMLKGMGVCSLGCWNAVILFFHLGVWVARSEDVQVSASGEVLMWCHDYGSLARTVDVTCHADRKYVLPSGICTTDQSM